MIEDITNLIEVNRRVQEVGARIDEIECDTSELQVQVMDILLGEIISNSLVLSSFSCGENVVREDLLLLKQLRFGSYGNSLSNVFAYSEGPDYKALAFEPPEIQPRNNFLVVLSDESSRIRVYTYAGAFQEEENRFERIEGKIEGIAYVAFGYQDTFNIKRVQREELNGILYDQFLHGFEKAVEKATDQMEKRARSLDHSLSEKVSRKRKTSSKLTKLQRSMGLLQAYMVD